MRLSRSLGHVLVLLGCAGPSAVSTPAPQTPTPSATPVVIPPVGTAATLDVGNWNIEWFGDAANGPTDDALQLSNVKAVIAGADIDIWGFSEVNDAVEWSQLKTQLPGYAGFLANEPQVANGPEFYSGFNNNEQKVGILFKTSLATLQGAAIILTDKDYDFAGRPPLEVKLRITLNGRQEDVVVIVLHMKCCTDTTSYARRQNAGNALKAYLDATYPTQRVWVIGDWNDDLDRSITTGRPSPYTPFSDDGSRYSWPTRALTNAGISSTTGFPDFIDHQLLTNEAAALYVSNSAGVLRLDQQIANYAATTTDHFPVYSRYNWQ